MSRPWENFTNQTQWKEYLQNLLKTNDKALYRAIVLISNYQTPEEKALGVTIDSNKKGFGTVDARFLTSMALKIKGGVSLTEKEKAICRNKMPKYWHQLYLISKKKEKNHETKEEQSNHNNSSSNLCPATVPDPNSNGTPA